MMINSRRCYVLVLVFPILSCLLQVIPVVSALRNIDVINNSNNNNKIISLPLIPHHVVLNRRRRELKEQRNLRVLLNSNTTTSSKSNRPGYSRYDERFLQGTSNEPPADQVAGLFQGYGTHYADLWCGSPPQRQTVIVDTGSGVTAFPCNECSNCGVPDYHIDALFDETKSSSFHKLTCQECLRGSCGRDNDCSIGMSYQEGSSWNAFEAIDLCYVGGLHNEPVVDDGKVGDDLDPFHAPAFSFNMKFGCQTKLTGLFITQLADGIMGMDVAPAAFWQQMYDAQKISNKAFSLCFSRSDEAARTGTEAGAMSMGGTDPRLHNTPMVYSATSSQASGFYVVHIRKMYLRAGGGGISAQSADPSIDVQLLDIDENDLNSGRVIVDSGTTDTYFSRRIGTQFKTVWEQMSGENYGHDSKKISAEDLAKYPTILFQLSGDETLNQQVVDQSETGTVVGLAGELDPTYPLDVILAIPPEHYFEYDPDVDAYISRFYVDEGSGGVFGANSMMGHDVYFDVENFHVGWSESACDYTTLVKDYQGMEPTPPPGDDTTTTATSAPSAASGEAVDEFDEDLDDEDEIDEIIDEFDEDEFDEMLDELDGIDEDEIDEILDELDEFDDNEYDADEYDEDEGEFFDDVDDEENNEPDEDYGLDSNDKPSGSYSYEPDDGFCSGLKCQMAILGLVIFMVIYCAIRMLRRSTTGPTYDLADASELELQTTSSSGEFINGSTNGNKRNGSNGMYNRGEFS